MSAITLQCAYPGIGGSLGKCAVCGSSFAAQVLLGTNISTLKLAQFDKALPVHTKCGDAVVQLTGEWSQVRGRFPRGPLYEAFEQAYAASLQPAEDSPEDGA